MMYAILLLCLLSENEYRAEIIRVKDGDTFNCNVYMDWGVAMMNQEIRVVDCDTWEVSRRRRTVVITDEELVKGKIAKGVLETLFKKSHRILVVPQPQAKEDPYGRREAKVIVEDKDGKRIGVGDFMRAHGHQRHDPLEE